MNASGKYLGNGYYKQPLDIFIDGIEHFSYVGLKSEVQQGLDKVKDIQESFNEQGEDLKVIGYFNYLREEYDFIFNVTEDTELNDVLKAIKEQILPYMEDRVNRTKETISVLKEIE